MDNNNNDKNAIYKQKTEIWPTDTHQLKSDHMFSVNTGKRPVCYCSVHLPFTSSSSSLAPCPLQFYLRGLPSPHPPS